MGAEDCPERILGSEIAEFCAIRTSECPAITGRHSEDAILPCALSESLYVWFVIANQRVSVSTLVKKRRFSMSEMFVLTSVSVMTPTRLARSLSTRCHKIRRSTVRNVRRRVHYVSRPIPILRTILQLGRRADRKL
jgi:hypothetical protein